MTGFMSGEGTHALIKTYQIKPSAQENQAHKQASDNHHHDTERGPAIVGSTTRAERDDLLLNETRVDAIHDLLVLALLRDTGTQPHGC